MYLYLGFYGQNIEYAQGLTKQMKILKKSVSVDSGSILRNQEINHKFSFVNYGCPPTQTHSSVRDSYRDSRIDDIESVNSLADNGSVSNEGEKSMYNIKLRPIPYLMKKIFKIRFVCCQVTLFISFTVISITSNDSKILVPWDDSQHELKEGNNRFRWNLVFNVLMWTIIPLPLWLPFVNRQMAINSLPLIQITMMLCWLVVSISAWVTYFKLWSERNRVFQLGSNFEHLIVISTYKEPLSLLISTIGSIELQELSKSNVNLTVSFEERTPECNEKIKSLTDRFSGKFKRLIFTSHPYNLPGEIPGKCSNANHGIRESMARLHNEGVNTDDLIITTCDADTKCHPSFVNALAEQFSECKYPHQSVFQSPLLYNWKLDEASVVTRVTGIMRGTLMMGALIPFNINTMSVFSFSGKLCKSGNFIHPNYQMDDIIALIRWMGVVGKRLNIVMVPVPTLSGPTSGRVVEEELREWAIQARRWTIGAGEVFHYFMIKSRRIPFLTSLSWGLTFVIYYGILLCCSHLYGVTLSISYVWIWTEAELPLCKLVVNASLFLLYLNSLSMFLLDWVCPKLLIPQPDEKISIIRNIYQFLISPLVIIGYSLIEFWSIQELAVRGKKVCNHKPSKKTEL